MKTYTRDELNEILAKHKQWLNGIDGGVRADLRSADLSSADLRCAIGEMRKLRSMQIEKYMVSYTDEMLNIGYQSHTIEEWKNFSDETISKMDSGALEWWTKWKPIILQIIEISPAEPTGVTK